jgi:hypothetical protein
MEPVEYKENEENEDNKDAEDEKGDYVMQTMLTCIGNKRKLVKQIYGIIDDIRQQLGKSKLILVDGFAGSSVVSRQLSYLADTLYFYKGLCF